MPPSSRKPDRDVSHTHERPRSGPQVPDSGVFGNDPSPARRDRTSDRVVGFLFAYRRPATDFRSRFLGSDNVRRSYAHARAYLSSFHTRNDTSETDAMRTVRTNAGGLDSQRRCQWHVTRSVGRTETNKTIITLVL